MIPSPNNEEFCWQLLANKKLPIRFAQQRSFHSIGYAFDIGESFFGNQSDLQIEKLVPNAWIPGTIPFTNNVINSITNGGLVELLRQLKNKSNEMKPQFETACLQQETAVQRQQQLDRLGIP